jgi:hypothetical protein
MLVKIAAVLARHHLPHRAVETNKDEGPRFSWGREKHETDGVLPRIKPCGLPLPTDHRAYDNSSIRPPAHDATYYSGEKDGSSAWRVMVKELDTQNPAAGTRTKLGDSEKRARIEVTLNTNEVRRLGIYTLDDFQNLRFQTLQRRYFQFALPTLLYLPTPGKPIEFVRNKLEDIRIQRFLLAGVVGLRDMDNARINVRKLDRKLMKKVLGRPLRRMERAGTGPMLTMTSYDELNSMVGVALANLGRRARAAND